MVEQKGGQTDGRIRQSGQRLRARRHHEAIGDVLPYEGRLLARALFLG
ncbi:hypothetical protein OG799_07995 [Micromonospora sp. NBC_00898]|nr:hypothetical protein OG799_07995 [Micromonospora sp. NBC_00898]